jgi:hypothetical protein
MQFKDLSESPEPTKISGPLIQRRVDNTGLSEKLMNNNPRNEATTQLRQKINASSVGQLSLIQRKVPKGSSRFQQIATTMGEQHGVDTSGLVATHNSSFPGKLNAEATIQGSSIHFRPGKDTDHNIRHEVAHAIDNTLNGAPKGDQVVNGQKVDTTREKVVDRMAKGSIIQPSPKKADMLGMSPVRMRVPEPNSLTSVQCLEVKKTDSEFKTYTELMDLTVADLMAYANKQADWHKRLIMPVHHDYVRTLLDFLRNQEGVDGACEDFKSLDLWTKIKNIAGSAVDPDKSEKIKAYTRGIKRKSAHCKKQEDVDQALAFGDSILKLEEKIPKALLAHIFTDKMFDFLHELDGVDDFVNYYETCKPHLAANNGSEILNYLRMRHEDNVDPVDYHETSLKGWVRNYHRFEKDALDKLKENFIYKNKDKLLTLILHSQLDHNGAFFRDKKLTQLITNSELYVLMIEGAENLDSAKTKIDSLLQTHAQGGVIDQVMIAGHGDARSMELTGKTDDYKERRKENIDLRKSTAFLDHILDKLVNKTGEDKAAVVVFNACLTNSNAVDTSELNLTGEVAEDAKKIRDYIAKNPSLATYVTQWAAKKIVRRARNIKAIGANASTTSGLDFFDENNRLTLTDTRPPPKVTDSKLTASKLDYVAEGIEPTGALRAALEAWAADAGTDLAVAAITERANKGDDKKWSEQLIRSLFARGKKRGQKRGQVAFFIILYDSIN